MMKIFVYLFLVAAIFSSIETEAQNYSQRIYHAYIHDMPSQWQTVMDEMEKMPLSPDEKLELINYYYGYIGYLIENNRNKEAKPYVEKGLKLIDEILLQNPDDVTANAYKGSFLSFRMTINKLKVIGTAPESMKYINKAYELNPKNIQAVTDKGNMMAFAPKIVGGDKKQAVNYYVEAIKLIESQNNTSENWFYLNVLVTLAKTYQDLNENEKASQTYHKILQKEPDFTLVRDNLYPNFLANHK